MMHWFRSMTAIAMLAAAILNRSASAANVCHTCVGGSTNPCIGADKVCHATFLDGSCPVGTVRCDSAPDSCSDCGFNTWGPCKHDTAGTCHLKSAGQCPTGTTECPAPEPEVPTVASGGQCGEGFGRCPENECCSQYGYCGVTLDHCNPHTCNPLFSSEACPPRPPTDDDIVTVPSGGQCGEGFGHCPHGECCSQHGYCGASEDHCNPNTCQHPFSGDFCPEPTDPTDDDIVTVPSGGQCGDGFGHCPHGECCSEHGLCGVSEDHCNPNTCQHPFSGDSCPEPTPEDDDEDEDDNANNQPDPTSPERCGDAADGGSCGAGWCCSQYNWCGLSSDHCSLDAGCNPLFGTCKEIDDEPVEEPDTEATCGNGICENSWAVGGETTGNCPADCGPAQPTSVVWACQNDKDVAITFDDGPSTVTPNLLDILDQAGIPVSFFVVGVMAETNPAILAREASSGYSIASHSYSHPHLNSLSLDRVAGEFNDAHSAITANTCLRPRLFRPPFGELNEARRGMLANMGMRAVLWNADTFDWRDAKTNPQAVLDAVAADLSANSPKGIIHLQHDLLQESIDLVPQILSLYRQANYRFVSLEQCVWGDSYTSNPTYQWQVAKCDADTQDRRLAKAPTPAGRSLRRSLQESTESECPVSEWSEWSRCDVGCGVGTQTRMRVTIPMDQELVNPACGEMVQQRQCHRPVDCVSDAVYSNWSEWSECSKPCAGGTQVSTRKVLQRSASHGPMESLTRTRLCNVQSCVAPGEAEAGARPTGEEEEPIQARRLRGNKA